MQLAAPRSAHARRRRPHERRCRLLSRTKLYWGLIAIFLIGVLGSPVTFQGQQHLPLLRQSARRAAPGVDHRPDRHRHDRRHHHRRHRPVGRLADGDLLGGLRHAADRAGRHAGRADGRAGGRRSSALVVGAVLARFVLRQCSRRRRGDAARPRHRHSAPSRGCLVPAAVGAGACGAGCSGSCCRRCRPSSACSACCSSRPASAFCFGAINGLIIVGGRLQPFIVTLAMMVTALGIARLTAGQNNAVLPVYTGSNAVAEFDVLRSLVFGIIPMPGLFFIAAIVIYGAVSALHAVRPLRLCDRRQRGGGAAVGHRVGRVKIVTYAISGLLAGIAARALRRAVSAGQAGCRRRARARRHRRRGHRRHQPDGRARRPGRHLLRRADLRPAVQHPAAAQHQFQPAARAEGPDHRRHGARAGAQCRRPLRLSAPAAAVRRTPRTAAAERPSQRAIVSKHGGNANETP